MTHLHNFLSHRRSRTSRGAFPKRMGKAPLLVRDAGAAYASAVAFAAAEMRVTDGSIVTPGPWLVETTIFFR